MFIRRNKEVTLKDAIEAMLKSYRLDQKLDEAKVIAAWESATGKLIARHTLNLEIREKVLYIKTDSAAIKHELSLQKSKVLKRLNKAVGREVVTDLWFQ